MRAGIKLGASGARILVAIGAVATLAFILACASTPSSSYEPGLYNLRGWNNWGSDIDGEIGHRMYVAGPTARCEPSRKWSGSTRILSGSLPPGLYLDNGFNIVGIPSDRGHWIVSIELYDVYCGSETYRGLTQEIRFHITGSGRVVQ